MEQDGLIEKVIQANVMLSIKRYRSMSKITLSELIKFLDISPEEYQLYESENKTPDLVIILKLALLYQVPIDYFCFNIESDGFYYKDRNLTELFHLRLRMIENPKYFLNREWF